MKLSDIAKAIQAKLHGPDRALPPIVIDSRKIQGNDFFIALKGENHDGHDFIADAVAKGVSAVLANRAPMNAQESAISFLEVEDTTKALGLMAAYWRKLHPVPMVGLTGSCGKTTVKGMIESICQQQGKTLATSGNFNNHIGLPLTLLRLDDSYKHAVIEMGANHMGEIGYLGKIAQPQISLITNVRPAHLQGFGSVEGVAKAKGEIYSILPADGTAILNIDEPFSDYWRETIGSRKLITYGLQDKAMVHARDVSLNPFDVEFTLCIAQDSQRIKIGIPGQHTVVNALAAAAAGFSLGISMQKIKAGLEAFQGVPGRLRRFKGLAGAWVIDDSYNANPGSMTAALDVLARCDGKKIFVMGDMGELGENTIQYHIQIGRYAREKGIDMLMSVGTLSEHAANAFGEGAKNYPSKDTLVDDLKKVVSTQTIVLVKGSRSAKMEVVTTALSEGA